MLEMVNALKFNLSSQEEYLIKWRGYFNPSWEPKRTFQKFYILIADYEKKKGRKQFDIFLTS